MDWSIIYYCLILINAIAFLSGRNIKFVSIPSAIFLVLFVMGKRFDNNFIAYDLRNYQLAYEDVVNYNTLELGYKALNEIGNAVGLTFDQFYMIVVALTMTTIILAVKRIGGNLHLVITCWLIYFVLISMDQLRNQAALAIMMIAMLPLVTDKKKPLFRRIIVIGIASLFHISFILFLIPLLLTYKKDMSFAIKWLFVSVVIYFGLMITSGYQVLNSIINSFVSAFENTDKYEGYASSHTSLSSLLSFFIYVVSLFALYIHQERNKSFIGENCKYAYENIHMFLVFLVFSSMLLSFLLVNAAFYRYIRDLSFITIAYIGINSNAAHTNFLKRLSTMLMALLISCGWLFFDIVVKGYIYDYNHYFFDNVILK